MSGVDTVQQSHLPTDHLLALQGIEEGYWWYQGRVLWAKHLLAEGKKLLPDGTALDYVDLGCGTGGFAREILAAHKVNRAAVIDGDPAALQLAKGLKAEVRKENLSEKFQLPWPPSIVTCMDVMEHLPDDKAFLSQVAEQMAPKGILLLSVPAMPALYSEWDRKLGHQRRYTAGSLEKVFEGTGLKVVRMKYMWSFLMPAAPVRYFRSKRYQASMEFESVPNWMNRMLFGLSRLEWALSEMVPTPFGTSLIALAQKR